MSKIFRVREPHQNNNGPRRKVNLEFNNLDARLKVMKKAPYMVKMQHVSGSACVACSRHLNENDMYRRGYASGVELGLCGTCARFVTKSQWLSDDDTSPTLSEVDFEEDSDVRHAVATSSTFDPDFDPHY